MTMKWVDIFLLAWILAGCSSSSNNLAIPSSTLIPPNVSLTATPIPKMGTVNVSTYTPRPPTPTPSITPTFDVSSVMTFTLSAPEECPPPANIDLPDIDQDPNQYTLVFRPNDRKALDYLNQGGSPGSLVRKIKQGWKSRAIFEANEAIADLTGDGIPEILIIPAEVYIFGCHNGEYRNLFNPPVEMGTSFNGIDNQLVGIQDMNLNGIPEIVIADFGAGGMAAGQGLSVYVYEWDGTRFVTRIPKWEGYEVGASLAGGRLDEYLPTASIKDVDNNGTKELVLTGGITNPWYGEYYWNFPWRDQSDIYTWNGENFVNLTTIFSPPIYRYQAVQDGDRAMLSHEYDKALKSYQEAVFNKNLLGWSRAHKDREILLPQYTWEPNSPTPTPPPIPPDDPKEYPRLAAYARYRIMLLHLFQGNLNEAKTVYETLQNKFPEGSDGHEFALVAKAFWDEYNVSQNVAESCAAAINVADEYEENLHFLGSDYHNSMQDILYTPQDVCPFQ